jgi:alpha-mannosidase
MTDVVNPSLQSFVDRLHQLTQLDAIDQWHVCEIECDIADLPSQSFIKLDLNEKRDLVWEKGRKVRWFYQEFVLPDQLQGYPLTSLTLRLALTWWAELAEVFVNGKKVQEGDLFDHSCRIVLSDSVVPGEKVAVAIRLVSPGHDIGGLMRSVLIYESDYDAIDPGFVADELAVLQSYLEAFAPDESIQVELDWSLVSDRTHFDRALEAVRRSLLPFSSRIKQHTIYMLGHAHLDMAWLWDVNETWRAAERTFKSVLNLQKDFPDLTFCHTTPALYEWIEQNRPELFAEIQAHVKAGTWEIVGGMWVEPEMNLISGESIARQILYGQRYYEQKFGKINRIAWLPDTFGFNWQLPQLLQQGGMEYFVTQKLRWNDTNKYPYEFFDWQAPDGSKVFSLMSSPIGEGIDPIKMSAYAWEWTTRTQTYECMWLPGVGDHGGGPTRDMLEVAKRWEKSPFFPKLEFTTALNYLDKLATQSKDSLPIWNDEIYLEFHRGCYTTHGDQKKFNRECESAIYEAELWASLATITANQPYPKQELETAWKKILFNQFHDILPGSSITQVFIDANQEWREAAQICADIKVQAKAAIANQIALPLPPHLDAKPLVVFNSLNWSISQVCTQFIDEPEGQSSLIWKVCDETGNEVESESTFHQQGNRAEYLIKFYAQDIPPIGYRCFWLYSETSTPLESEPSEESFILENEFLKVEIEPETGNLSRIFDKIRNQEILRESGNQLQIFQDKGQYWDAWNIDPNYADFPLESAQLLRITPASLSKLRSSIHVDKSMGQSTFYTSYFLEKGSAALKIFTCVDWQERHVVVKASLPLNLDVDSATYGIPCGAIKRTTKPESAEDKAKWEVPALGWVDLGDEQSGVSLLSDCKHGINATSNELKLTLLRGPEFPDPDADRGTHVFSYLIYPHSGDWRSAQTVRKSHELNHPLKPALIQNNNHQGTLPPVHSFLDLQSENLILSTFKQSEDHPDEWILRCYECHGQSANLELKTDLNLTQFGPIDLLERPLLTPHSSLLTSFTPYQIRTFRLKQ